ncbi:MAG: dipeptidase PepE [Bacteroidetes bacterium CG02_land_8_20_14_3_00_31_25]|nr:dipeptidase PepE [Bacteroidota bacterium]PIV61163.1 MAG: dipeptidase PepE [Bacteroidetes bacterium CG02_land_8_20_14_3_00_31_25]PIX35206.1 MAG: dipeptidase PepE [Bacteroidetes bacterium CG_4_8_14_3_um_filter_31_14]PIY03239.1 MAG: dipeptidase PepE [Bacteroidetes bacterium CG_4_10_14_3_um_filter_31_20]
MKLLLISNSTNAGEEYLGYPTPNIKEFLGNKCLNCIFIPFAAVTFSYDEYEKKVQKKFNQIGHNIKSIHHFTDKIKEIENADVIVVGGGNTFQLLKKIQDFGLLDIVRKKVLNGTPYIGWSAGSNVACPTIKTTNDMPVVEPSSFDAFNLIKFQINPHYLDANPIDHAGETREQRILEFIEVNPDIYVVGLREGCILKIENDSVNLIGNKTIRLFKRSIEPFELSKNDNFNILM